MGANPAPFEGSPIWDPVSWSWPLLGILLAGTFLLTLVFVVWTILQPDEPEHDTDDLVDKATRSDRERARTIQRRLDADTGRADTSEPELR